MLNAPGVRLVLPMPPPHLPHRQQEYQATHAVDREPCCLRHLDQTSPGRLEGFPVRSLLHTLSRYRSLAEGRDPCSEGCRLPPFHETRFSPDIRYQGGQDPLHPLDRDRVGMPLRNPPGIPLPGNHQKKRKVRDPPMPLLHSPVHLRSGHWEHHQVLLIQMPDSLVPRRSNPHPNVLMSRLSLQTRKHRRRFHSLAELPDHHETPSQHQMLPVIRPPAPGYRVRVPGFPLTGRWSTPADRVLMPRHVPPLLRHTQGACRGGG